MSDHSWPDSSRDKPIRFSVDGVSVAAYVRGGKVSASGPAIVSNARWLVSVAGTDRWRARGAL